MIRSISSSRSVVERRAADVIVIGDSTIGAGVAYSLAKRGKKVSNSLLLWPRGSLDCGPRARTTSRQSSSSSSSSGSGRSEGPNMARGGGREQWSSVAASSGGQCGPTSSAEGLEVLAEACRVAGVTLSGAAWEEQATSQPWLRQGAGRGLAALAQPDGGVINAVAADRVLRDLAARAGVAVKDHLQLRGWQDCGSMLRLRASSTLQPSAESVFEGEQVVLAPGTWLPEALALWDLELGLQVKERVSVRCPAASALAKGPLLRSWGAAGGAEEEEEAPSHGMPVSAQWLLFPPVAGGLHCKLSSPGAQAQGRQQMSPLQTLAKQGSLAPKGQASSKSSDTHLSPAPAPELASRATRSSTEDDATHPPGSPLPLSRARRQAGALVHGLGWTDQQVTGVEGGRQAGAESDSKGERDQQSAAAEAARAVCSYAQDVLTPDGLPLLGWHPGFEAGRVLVVSTVAGAWAGGEEAAEAWEQARQQAAGLVGRDAMEAWSASGKGGRLEGDRELEQHGHSGPAGLTGPGNLTDSTKASTTSSRWSEYGPPQSIPGPHDGSVRKNLEDALARVRDKYGKMSVFVNDAVAMPDMEFMSTGSLSLDTALGGGIPKGRIIEIYGPESSGKTTLAISCIAQVQALGGYAALIDAEYAFDPKYATSMGVNVPQLIKAAPDYGEMALDITDELARSGAVDLIVVDSVSSLVARQELENDLGAPTVGLQARMMSQALRKLVGSCSKTGCSIIFINQIRMKVGVMFGSPETTSGGQALKYYASVRIDVRKKDVIGVKEKAEGIKVMAKIIKNKVAPPFRTAMFSILFASGLDRVGGIMDAAEGAGVLDKRAGGCYYYQDSLLGRVSICDLLNGRITIARMRTATSTAMSGVSTARKPYGRWLSLAGPALAEVWCCSYCDSGILCFARCCIWQGYDKVLEMLRTDQELCKRIEVETRAELNKDPELAGALEDESETEDGDPGAEFDDPGL
ncbi:hypothetical protein QJQ45_028016 [Haematococcus lacustris]|nr:hypothetical protein QJQ45_028016 [Haematococcus lacustris]